MAETSAPERHDETPDAPFPRLAGDESPREGRPAEPPVRWREMAAIVLLVALADLTIYRGQGLAGYAALFLGAPLVLFLGAPQRRGRIALVITGGMLALLAGKLLWCGFGLLVPVGLALLGAFAMSLGGLRPYAPDVLVFALQTIPAGLAGLLHYHRSSKDITRPTVTSAWLSLLLPLAAILVFGTLFVLANPDLLTSFSEALRQFSRWLSDALGRFSPSFGEIVFWVAAAWISIGLLRPVMRRPLLPPRAGGEPPSTATAKTTRWPLYGAFRNTLLAVIGLFAVYLVFEYQTLWFRSFPKGFYYAGYAHQGAFWLTVALGLATLVLSAIFRGRMPGDRRMPGLRRLAWLWSAENLVLALAVYHRMFIYIDFNGMTRMRTIGLAGISAVVAGFVLVICKIAYQRDFIWLVHRQLWAAALAVFLLAVTPVDTVIHAYNVRRIMAGELAPVVQITEHPVSSEGVLVLRPLLDCPDETIREGIRAMLAERAIDAQAAADGWRRQGWTSFQVADYLLGRQLDGLREQWDEYLDPQKRAETWARFRQYAYQWY